MSDGELDGGLEGGVAFTLLSYFILFNIMREPENLWDRGVVPTRLRAWRRSVPAATPDRGCDRMPIGWVGSQKPRSPRK